MRRLVPLLGVAVLASAPAVALAFDPAEERDNYAKVDERFEHDSSKPEYRALAARRGAESELEYFAIRATDRERAPENPCAHRLNECTGDARFYAWEDGGHGLVRDVLYTARSGATISGKVWATADGPARRPGIVITTGSIQAPETLYWPIAANLAKRGYVVLTYDVQGQGRSDTFGEGADRNEGVPSQQGRPFFDGTEDALDFLLSSPAAPYRPRPSCTTGTSHADKQERRVRAGLNTGHNPFWQLVDAERIGIAGHSLGAAGVSFIGQRDPRVDAIVAWDNLSAPRTTNFGQTLTCASAPATRLAPPITKPALGMSNDYGLTPTPYTDDPDPQEANEAFAAYRQAGVDVAQLNIRGGTHYEYSYIGMPEFPATLRGMDMATWYTAVWFDKYVTGDPTADRRLLTNRWREDAPGKAVDAGGDGNLFSFYLRSRIDVSRAGGGRAVCDDVRAGCAALVGSDGEPVPFSYLRSGLTRDGAGGGDGSRPGATPGPPRRRTPALRVPKRISLKGSRRFVRIKIGLPEQARVSVQLRRKGARKPLATWGRRRLGKGWHRITMRLPRFAPPGAYQVEIVFLRPGGPTARIKPLKVRR